MKIKSRKEKNARRGQAAIAQRSAAAGSSRGQAAIEKPSAFASRRGQAAMEYLMTYGWAILVLVIVLAVLAYFLPRLTQTPEVCTFTTGFTCTEPALVNEGGEVKVRFNLQNGKGQTINVSKVLCTTASKADADVTSATPVPPDRQMMSAGASQQINASCVDKSGMAVTLGPNSDFRGTLVVYYNFVPDVITVPRSGDGMLSGPVLQG